MCTHPSSHDNCSASGTRPLVRFTRRAAIAGLTAGAATAVAASTAQAGGQRSPRRRAADLTHVLSPDVPGFTPGEEAQRRTVVTIEDDGYYIQEWTLIEHIGTHLDAPGHFVPGARLADALTVEDLVAPAAVIDIASRAARDPDTTVSVDDLRRFERRHGRIPRGSVVLMHSGWAAKIDDADAYRGTDSDGGLHFPGFSGEATAWLTQRRRVRGVGVDTLSTDPGVSETFDTHITLGEADAYGLENLADLDQVPPTGSTITVGLIPYFQGSGGQARVLAAW